MWMEPPEQDNMVFIEIELVLLLVEGRKQIFGDTLTKNPLITVLPKVWLLMIL